MRDNFCRWAALVAGTGDNSMATLTIASKNYGSWSLRGWLLCKMAGLEFEVEQAKSDDPSTRAELLLLSPSFLVPCLTHDGVKVWDTLAIAEYLNELNPGARLLPAERLRAPTAVPYPARCIPVSAICAPRCQ
jgi:Glutathione S-transferase, N-terminal domain